MLGSLFGSSSSSCASLMRVASQQIRFKGSKKIPARVRRKQTGKKSGFRHRINQYKMAAHKQFKVDQERHERYFVHSHTHTPTHLIPKTDAYVYDVARKQAEFSGGEQDAQPARPDKFAVFSLHSDRIAQVQGTQFKVMEGDRIMVQKLIDPKTRKPYNLDDQVEFDSVLMIGTPNQTAIGQPIIPNATVHATVEEQTQVKHEIVFRKIIHKWKKKKGHRAEVTILRIDRIQFEFDENAPTNPSFHESSEKLLPPTDSNQDS